MTKLYREADGTWYAPGTQSRHAARVDVNTGPRELAALLNLQRAAADDMLSETPPESPAEAPQSDESAPRCPKCSFDPKAAQRAATALAAGMNADAVADHIRTFEGWQLAILINAVIERASELQRFMRKEAANRTT